MKKEQKAIKEIVGIINSDEVQIGSALPSERKLSERLNVSRNTIRNAFQKLEARGIIDIRYGSGCYLLCKHGYVQDWLGNRTVDSIEEIPNLIEARYLFEPYAVFLSAKRIEKNNIHTLEKCLMRLSQAIIAVKKQAVAKEDAEFRRIIYCSSKNRFVIFTMNQLITNNQCFFKILDQMNEIEKDRVFSDYVGILKGLEQKNAVLVKETVKGNILQMCELLIKYTDIQLTQFMKDAMGM
ncbi:MAG: GntR family transcriptional regulator [Proteobacteria bacterium]|nr:GntR family transcriptional regulator [Pseudomonadota bacterium]MBU1584895.1 GntR family transcriptional regulator [Pseudomonadota bacterium]MBU2453492.1 GntR family transcriptional regulator [Pseudomonadota bacterium]MBU2631477.1 GntR family transcriptional regulator [Pseudomonadota bacterium]